jgi:tetratricopeptide (TPR) repeat protein
MSPLQNDEQFPDPPQSSSNDDQPQEHQEVDKVKTPPQTNDHQQANDTPTIPASTPPIQETAEPTAIQRVSTEEDKTLQEPTQKVEPSANGKTSTASSESVVTVKPTQEEDRTLQESSPQIEPSAEEKASTRSEESTLPAGTASPLNQTPTQPPGEKFMAADQDANAVQQPPMNPNSFPPDSRSMPGGMWQSYPQPTPATPPGPLNPTPFPPDPRYTPGVMWQSYPQPKPATTPKPLSRLARPLPLWLFLGGIVLIVVLLVVLHLTGSDWGNGAANASFAAALIGLILVLALIVRSPNSQNASGMASPLNPNRRRQYIVSVLCIIVVFIYSGVSQALVPTLHIAQGRSLEEQRQWQAAINEYQLGGEKAPSGKDLARVYTSWGQALNKAHRYDEAMRKFEVVIQQFNTSSTRDQVKQAQSADINVRLTLAQQSMQTKNYKAATSSYDAILGLPYCDTACTNQVDALDATAYYNLGEEHLQAQDYAGTVSAFDVILTKFSSAPEAKQLHGDMAKALLGEGQNTRASNCSSAVPTYQRLAHEYGDTPEGQSATQDLNATQTVKGNFSNLETTSVYNQIGLTHGLNGSMSKDDVFAAWDATPVKVDIQGNGDFAFSGIAQGDYDLLWYGTKTTSDASYIYYYKYVEFMYSPTSLQPIYVAHVGPLCPVDMGKVTNSTLSSRY